MAVSQKLVVRPLLVTSRVVRPLVVRPLDRVVQIWATIT